MFMRNVAVVGRALAALAVLLVLLVLLVLAGCSEDQTQSLNGPGLGVQLTAEEIAAFRYTVFPNGDGLPAGSGNAIAGKDLYRLKCLSCHGPDGNKGINDRLVGGHATLTGVTPIKTVGSYWPYATTLFDYIRRAMPYPSPGSLSNDETYALTAYLLSLNGIIEPNMVLDAASLPQVQMPNREGFVRSSGY